METSQQPAVLTLCPRATFADGINDERERAELKRVAMALDDQGSLDVNQVIAPRF